MQSTTTQLVIFAELKCRDIDLLVIALREMEQMRVCTCERDGDGADICPHTATCVSSFCFIIVCVLICGYLSSYCYMCVVILLHMCPHMWISVSSYYYICVLILLHMCPHMWICVLVLLHMCAHTATATCKDASPHVRL
jgi:hypothetical protein